MRILFIFFKKRFFLYVQSGLKLTNLFDCLSILMLFSFIFLIADFVTLNIFTIFKLLLKMFQCIFFYFSVLQLHWPAKKKTLEQQLPIFFLQTLLWTILVSVSPGIK